MQDGPSQGTAAVPAEMLHKPCRAPQDGLVLVCAYDLTLKSLVSIAEPERLCDKMWGFAHLTLVAALLYLQLPGKQSGTQPHSLTLSTHHQLCRGVPQGFHVPERLLWQHIHPAAAWRRLHTAADCKRHSGLCQPWHAHRTLAGCELCAH